MQSGTHYPGRCGEPVAAPAEAQVTEVGSEEIGNCYVVLDLGSGYTAVCGQLKDVQVAQKQYVAKIRYSDMWQSRPNTIRLREITYISS